MALTNTNSVDIPLDVIPKYESLVSNSLDGESVYIRAKETIEQLFADGNINSTDKAQIIGSVVSNMVNSITQASMSTALEWAKYEKELALKKLEMDMQLEILNEEKQVKEKQVEQVEQQNRLAAIESKRVYGTATFDVDGNIISLADDGKVWTDMQLTNKQGLKVDKESLLVDSKIKESEVAIHKVIADTYINFGSFTYTLGTNGITSVTRNDANKTLSDVQKDIAIEQGKGYTYNAWANALTGSASMLGTAIASGDFDFSPSSSGDLLLKTVLNCAYNLSGSSTTTDEAIPANLTGLPTPP